MNQKFTQKAQNAIHAACNYARELGHTYIGSEHLLLGLAAEQGGIASQLLEGLGITSQRLKESICALAGVGAPTMVGADEMTPRSKRILEFSAELARKNGQTYIGTEYLLLAILEESDSVAVRALEDCGISTSDLKSSVSSFLGKTGPGTENVKTTSHTEQRGKQANQNEARNKSGAIAGAPTLSSYGKNLTRLALDGKLDPIIGRDRETDRVIQILSRRSKNNPCLIGEPGVGKTAVIEGLAQRIADGGVPETLREKMIVTLDIPSMIAGAKYRGEFEERLKNVMSEVAENHDIILFIDEIHTIIGAGAAEGAVDAANIIKPALARGEMQVIGATTVSEYRRHIEKDAALERRFQSVLVGEPSAEESIEILKGLRPQYEKHHGLIISDEAIAEAVHLSKRYITDRFLPDKAIDLIDEAASKLRISAHTIPPQCIELESRLARLAREKEAAIVAQNFEQAARIRDEEEQRKAEYQKAKDNWDAIKSENTLTVTAKHIADTVTQWTGIPISEVVKTENEKLLHMEETLNRVVIGQSSAIAAVTHAIQRGRTGLRDPHRPIGSFLFLGPSGIGKTELSRALSKVLFGDSNALIRLDMSEYMEKHSISKLIGSPPGYVGYDEGGQLTEKVRRRPYSVVLFDEIEKGHPDIYNLLLQILEDGVLTDSQGRQVDFKNTILIMTSNIGTSAALSAKKVSFLERDSENHFKEQHENTMGELKHFFRPEFLNRIDEMIIFNRLTIEDAKQITALFLEQLAERVRSLHMEIVFDPSVTELIVRHGFDPTNGARHLRRTVTREVEDRLSEAMLLNQIGTGERIYAYVDNECVVFRLEGEIN